MVTASQAREDDREENLYCVKKAGLIKIKSPLNAKAHNPPTHSLPYVRTPPSLRDTHARAGREASSKGCKDVAGAGTKAPSRPSLPPSLASSN